MENETITLDRLLVETGKSLLRAEAQGTMNGEHLTASVLPGSLALSDLERLLDRSLKPGELEVELKLGGSLQEIESTLFLNHSGLQKATFSTTLNLENQPALTRMRIQTGVIRPGEVVEISHPISLGEFSLRADGFFPISKPDLAQLRWEWSAHHLQYDTLHVSAASGWGELDGARVNTSLQLTENEEIFRAEAEISKAFSDSARWKATLNVEHVKLHHWLPLSDSQTNISLFAMVEGTGYTVPDSSWRYVLSNIHPLTKQKYPNKVHATTINDIHLEGIMGAKKFTASGGVHIGQSEVQISLAAEDMLEKNMAYTFEVHTKHLNLNELLTNEYLETDLNGVLRGQGRGKELEQSTLKGMFSLSKSEINGAELDAFGGEMKLENGIIRIYDGLLKSDIAEGSLKGQRNLFDITDPQNRLSLALLLKDPQPFAGLFNLQVLEARGELSGDVFLDSTGILKSELEVNLENIRIDSLFTARSIAGRVNSVLEENKSFYLNLNVGSPEIKGVVLQDITLKTRGRETPEQVDAEFILNIVGSERGRLEQEGILLVDRKNEVVDIDFEVFDVIAEQTALRLQKPFKVRFTKQSAGTDTLTLASSSGAFFQMGVPYASKLDQLAFAHGQDFNIGLIQDIVLGKRYVDGIISGDFLYQRSPDHVHGKGNIQLEKVQYKGAYADSMLLNYGIEHEVLAVDGSIFWEGIPHVQGWMQIPFVLDETELTDDFFLRPVKGEFKVDSARLDRFVGLLAEAGVTNTNGVFSFHGNMAGRAGAPIFSGAMTLNNPVLSGIPVDEVQAQFNFDNANDELQISSEIFARGETAVHLEIKYPINYNFRNFRMNMAGENSPVFIQLTSNDLNLGLFNDFLNPDYLANLSGSLNANLELKGTFDNITPTGYINLHKGRMDVPYSNISVRDISALLEVDETSLRVQSIHAKSGPGNFNVSGEVLLNGIYPTSLLLRAQAKQFQLSNSNDLKLIVDFDADLQGPANTPRLLGDVTVRSGFYYLDFANDLVEEIQLEEESISSFAPYDSLSIDIALNVNDNFFVRSRDYLDVNMKMLGSLDIVKEVNEETRMFGSLNASYGYIKPLGKRFNVEHAAIVFSGPHDNPELDIRSSYTPPTRQKGEAVKLYYLINGMLQERQYRFESEPQMEQSDIICYTLFNKPCYSLESWQSVFASSGNGNAVDVLTDVLLDQVETLATRELGVDVVQIDNSGQNGATAIKTGWYLNERTFFSIINELTNTTPKTLFILEYILTENVDLIFTQGDDDRQGIDLRFQYDY